MPLDSDSPTVKAAVFGQQVSDFVDSPVGKYLIEKADEERDKALNALKNVASWRRKRIQSLQNDIWRAESVQHWLLEAIFTGKAALQKLESDEEFDEDE